MSQRVPSQRSDDQTKLGATQPVTRSRRGASLPPTGEAAPAPLQPADAAATPPPPSASRAASAGPAVPPPPGRPLPPERCASGLIGFRLVRVLASGGEGELWLAEDLISRERVAIKVARPDDANAEARLLNECCL